MGLNSVQKPDKISGAIFDKDYLMDTFRNTNEVKSLAKKPVQNYTNRDVEIMTLTFGGIKDLGFVKYDNLSNEELSSLAHLCQKEQGTAEGAAMEASLIANRYELYNGAKYGNLYDFVENCKWFAKVHEHLTVSNDLNPKVEAAVRAVLVDGKRILPAYVDEHDCLKDIVKVTNNGVKVEKENKSDYKQYLTKIRNKYVKDEKYDIYNFYSFSNPDLPFDKGKSDVFGYLSEINRKNLGEDHYNFRDLGLKLSNKINSSN